MNFEFWTVFCFETRTIDLFGMKIVLVILSEKRWSRFFPMCHTFQHNKLTTTTSPQNINNFSARNQYLNDKTFQNMIAREFLFVNIMTINYLIV